MSQTSWLFSIAQAIPVKEFIESRIFLDVGLEEFIQIDGVRVDERRDCLDRFWAVVDSALLNLFTW